MTRKEWEKSDDPEAMLAWVTDADGPWQPGWKKPPRTATDAALRRFGLACALARGEDAPGSAGRVAAQMGDVQDWAFQWSRNTIGAANEQVPQTVKADILRDAMGDPWADIPSPWRLNPEWQDWHAGGGHGRVDVEEPRKWLPAADWLTPTVISLAEAAFRGRANPCPVSFPHPAHDYCDGTPSGGRAKGVLDPARLAVLSDALEEAGCTQDALLAHLRGLKRCWLCEEVKSRPGVDACSVCGQLGAVGPFGGPCAFGWVASGKPHYAGCWAVALCRNGE